MKRILASAATVTALLVTAALAQPAQARSIPSDISHIHTVRAGCSLPGPTINGVKHSLHASYAAVSFYKADPNGFTVPGGYIYASAVKSDVVQYKTPVSQPARFLYKFYKFRARNGDQDNFRVVDQFRNPAQWGGYDWTNMLQIDNLGVGVRTVEMTAYWTTYRWNYSTRRWVNQRVHPICDSGTDGTRLTFAFP